jgi:hypothetical protein
MMGMLWALPMVLSADAGLDAETRAAVKAAVAPTEQDEKWLEIGWKANLWEARKEAAAKGKPILLWEMDGHPLGCT